MSPGDLLAIVSRWKASCVAPGAGGGSSRIGTRAIGRGRLSPLPGKSQTPGNGRFRRPASALPKNCSPSLHLFGGAEAQRFDHVLIDEYQDTNRSQYQIVKALAGGHRNLCVVGDDDQSIYAWRGAEVAHILRFQQDWPEAKIVRLEDNYRSTAAILLYANTLIGFNRQRHEKVLRAARPGGERPTILQCQDEAQEAERIVNDIRASIDSGRVAPRDIAILCRTNEQPRSFETELRRARCLTC